MNKKIIIVLGIIIVVVSIIAAVVIVKNIPNLTGNISENSKNINIKGYKLNIYAKQEKYDKSYFRTSFIKYDSDKSKNTYYVDFVDISTTESEPGVVYDMVPPSGYITINEKKYEYYIDELSNWKATLYYSVSDNERLKIEINGGNVYAANGSQLKTLATVTKNVIESKELAEVLKYDIRK